MVGYSSLVTERAFMIGHSLQVNEDGSDWIWLTSK